MQPKPPPSRDLSDESWLSNVHTRAGTRVPELNPGDRLGSGRFEIQRKIGRGAMGVVYAALDRERDRVVALKTLQLASPESAYALKQEFRALNSLVHPNLVRLHELFVEPLGVYFTMDLIDGVPFDQFDRARLDQSLSQLASAVRALHAAGKLHRDLKPGNVLIDATGRVVVLDFGLVHDRDRPPGSSSPESSSLAGTPRYMAPELLSWGKASEKSDWYAVGVMLYEALTGSVPHDTGVARAVGTERPPPPSRHAPQMGSRFDELCQGLLDPNPETRATGDDILALSGVESRRAPASMPPPTRLVGRTTQLAHLAASYQKHLQQREPAAIFVVGRSGMGKSALMTEFLATCEGSSTVLRGRCHEQEAMGHKAFDDLIDSLGQMLCDEYSERVFEVILPAEAPHLLRLFPSLGRVPQLVPLTGDDTEADQRTLRQQGYVALRNVLCRLSATRPLILAIDDLQWGDLDSARLLHELFSGAEPPNCLLLLSYRDDEAEDSACLRRLLSGSRCLADLMDTSRIDVAKLSESDARALAASLLRATEATTSSSVRAQRTDRLCREADGSPLLLHELAAHLSQEEISNENDIRLADVVRARLGRVAPLAKQLFELSCLAGSAVRESLLSRALGDADVTAAIIELEAERLIRPRTSRSADAVEVVHDGIRNAALSLIEAERLRRLHEDLARAHNTGAEPDVDALFRHYAGAKFRAEAAYWAQKAAAKAKARLAFDRAAQLYGEALQLGDPDDPIAPYLRVQFANALADAGRGAEAAPLFLELAKNAPLADVLEYRRRAAEQWLFTGHIEEGLTVLTEVYQDVGFSLPRSKWGAMVRLAINRIQLRWRGSEFIEHRADAIAPRRLMEADAYRAGWMLSFVSPLHGALLQSKYLRLVLDLGEPSRVAMGLGIEALQHSIEGDNPGRWTLQQRARELAERIGTPHALGFQQLVDCNCSYLAGEWLDCSNSAKVAERLLTTQCRGSTWELNTLRFFWGMSLYYQGRFRELRRRSDGWLLDAEERGDRCAQSGVRLNCARSVFLANDDPQGAHEQIALALEEWRFPELGVHRFLAELARIQVFLYQGKTGGALQTVRHLRRELSTSTLSRVQLCRILFHYHSGQVAVALAAEVAGGGPTGATPGATTGTPASSTLVVRAPNHELRLRLRRAAKHERALLNEGPAWARALATYLGAQRAALDGNLERARAGLEQAVTALESCHMHAAAAGARWRLGALLGGDEGTQLQDAARAWMRSQGVLVPDDLLRALAPG